MTLIHVGQLSARRRWVRVSIGRGGAETRRKTRRGSVKLSRGMVGMGVFQRRAGHGRRRPELRGGAQQKRLPVCGRGVRRIHSRPVTYARWNRAGSGHIRSIGLGRGRRRDLTCCLSIDYSCLWSTGQCPDEKYRSHRECGDRLYSSKRSGNVGSATSEANPAGTEACSTDRRTRSPSRASI